MTDAGLNQRLGRNQRLRARSGFLLVQEHGRRIPGQTLVLYAMRRTEGSSHQVSRLGVTVSKKVGNAVVRNRVKRWIRESYRRLDRIENADVVVIAKPTAARSSFAATARELAGLVGRVQAR